MLINYKKSYIRYELNNFTNRLLEKYNIIFFNVFIVYFLHISLGSFYNESVRNTANFHKNRKSEILDARFTPERIIWHNIRYRQFLLFYITWLLLCCIQQRALRTGEIFPSQFSCTRLVNVSY